MRSGPLRLIPAEAAGGKPWAELTPHEQLAALLRAAPCAPVGGLWERLARRGETEGWLGAEQGDDA